MLKRLEKRVVSNFDWPLFLGMSALCFIGLGVLYSAGFDPDTKTSLPMQRQAASMCIGMVGFFLAMLLSTNFWRRSAFFFYFVFCTTLIMVDITGVVGGGARRWLNIGGFRFQPSELMKVGIILALARLFAADKRFHEGYDLRRLAVPAVVLGIPAGLTLVQPDLGTACCQLLIGGSMIFFAGVQRSTLIRIFLSVPVLAVPLWMIMHDYQRKRVLNFLSPEADPLGSGYHAIQSMIAVGSGSVMGKGLLQGTQTQLRFLPEQTTDFFFSVLAEEWGFFGSMLVLAVYGFLIYRLLHLASRCQDRFPAFVCLGAAAMLFWQVFINIGMVTGTLPVVGITLPLLSFGGSSVLTIMVALGLAAGVSSRRFLFSS